MNILENNKKRKWRKKKMNVEIDFHFIRRVPSWNTEKNCTLLRFLQLNMINGRKSGSFNRFTFWFQSKIVQNLN